MDKLPATDEPEGGTPALLGDVPRCIRQDLTVFSEADRPRQRDEMSIET